MIRIFMLLGNRNSRGISDINDLISKIIFVEVHFIGINYIPEIDKHIFITHYKLSIYLLFFFL